MKWFQGSINEAVATSKAKKAIFVVFVTGKDEASNAISQVLESDAILNQLEQDYFVAIKLDSGSESYKFFAQIYQLVPVPSIFFIGENGLPLEVVANTVTIETLSSKIQEILVKAGKVPETSANFIRAEQNSGVSTSLSQSNVNSRLTATGESSSSKTENTSPPIEVAATSSKENQPQESTMEEKLERAKKLIELQEQKRIEEEKRKEKDMELERRRTGKDVQKMRRDQQDLEIKQAYEDRMKEKAAEVAARNKVRQQIEQDKLERKQKHVAYQQQLAEQKEVPKPQVLACDQYSDTTRIQFRLPSGATHAAQFESTASLASLRDYVTANIQLPFSRFAMHTSYPRKDLTMEDSGKTLIELELVPTSVILILPHRNAGSSSAITRAQDNFLTRMFWTLLAPVFNVYNYVTGWLLGQPQRPGAGSNDNAGRRQNPESRIPPYVQNSNQPGERLRRNVNPQGSRTIRTQGNIHRLHSDRDDNDENNTWNGNSTQQM